MQSQRSAYGNGNCKFLIEPVSKLFGNGLPAPLIQYWISDLAPYNIYLRHAKNLTFSDCELTWGKADIEDIWEIGDEKKRPAEYNAVWREEMNPSDRWPCIDAFDIKGLSLHNFQGTGFGGESPFRFLQVNE